MQMDLAAEREYMFDHVYRQQQKRFYNTNMHGVDWEKMTAAYRRFLPHIDNNYDFAELLSEWLGELNVSHTGGRFYPKGQSEPTASLGLFSTGLHGKGMLIAEVVEKGPFDTANTRVKAGTVIEKIDGVEITPMRTITRCSTTRHGRKHLFLSSTRRPRSTGKRSLSPLRTVRSAIYSTAAG